MKRARKKEHRQKDHARKMRRCRDMRRTLIGLLGARCAECGEIDESELTFDHVHGIAWDRQRKSNYGRLKMYLIEASRGELRILCNWCNGSDGRRRQLEAAPF